jgi:hypothetical protein
MRTIKLSLLFLGIASFCGFASTIVNGDFETGDLSGWTSYATAYGPGTGTNGSCSGSLPCPIVTLFNTTGTGASDAAQFSVGLASGAFNSGDYEGGGIFQTVSLAPGTLNISLVWAVDNTFAFSNVDGGEFAFLLNGVVLNSIQAGSVGSSSIKMGSLSASTSVVTGGTYQIAVEITREFYSDDQLIQYVDNVTASGSATSTPEPSSFGFAVAGVALIFAYRPLRTVYR